MSDVIVIGYDDAKTADRVLEELLLPENRREGIEGAVAVSRDLHGHTKVKTGHRPFGNHSVLPRIGFRLATDMLLRQRLTGAAIGRLTGVEPGKAAVLVLVDESMANRPIEIFAKHGGDVLRSSLSHHDRSRIGAALHSLSPLPAA